MKAFRKITVPFDEPANFDIDDCTEVHNVGLTADEDNICDHAVYETKCGQHRCIYCGKTWR